LIDLQILEESVDPIGIADAVEPGQSNGGKDLAPNTAEGPS
jgi:hypothetical protein